jgi:hypothetical protein
MTIASEQATPQPSLKRHPYYSWPSAAQRIADQVTLINIRIWRRHERERLAAEQAAATEQAQEPAA